MTHRTRRRKHYKRAPVRTTPTTDQRSTLSASLILRYVSVATQTEAESNPEMVQTKRRTLNMPELESVSRISNLPIVETGLGYAENVYKKIKGSNSLFNWTLDQAENTIYSVMETAGPAVVLFQGPLTQVDRIVCKTLDLVEEKVPSIHLPPQMIYWNTKQYAKETVNTRIVSPVLKRADSVKQIGTSVLTSKYTAFAVDKLDGALDVADKYVDKYLPPDEQDAGVDVDKKTGGPDEKALYTIQHVDRLGRKLKKRLTRRTIAEVRALKEQSAEAVHVLVYVAELVAKDPVLAFQKGKELWASLSKDEPENQARPENVEQLIVLLTRESARRIVHLLNFTGTVAHKVNKKVTHSIAILVNRFLRVANSVVKTAHLEQTQQNAVSVIKSRAYSLTIFLKQLNVQLTDLLDSWAKQLSNGTVPNDDDPQTTIPVPLIYHQMKLLNVNDNSVNKNGYEHLNANSNAEKSSEQ
ncbi:lipid storage droplets surface-binding protein 1-like isoform X2 [Anthonomus grandis grandis]|uniref:lipid storage droplets surface-binding protein 1-like isoform X2 n=1 Tax=Anthonomus grandis grandis TaxID=2921223 RepID=UPI002165B4E8|nr:lipid storage droplets surface-binding protein 1-like isoform X2 [Anthonomus grandis grandis]